MARQIYLCLVMCAFLALTGCDKFKGTDGNRCNFDTTCSGTGADGRGSDGGELNSGESNAFSCTASPARSMIQLRSGDASTPVQVRVLGGSGDYSIEEGMEADGRYAGIASFGGIATIVPVWTSIGSKSHTVTVIDNESNQSTTCGFDVTVRRDLLMACDIILNDANPSVGQDITFNFQVSGPNGRYHFKFYPERGETEHYQLLKRITDTVREANHTYAYSASGLKNPELKIKNLDTQEVAHCGVSGGLYVRNPKMIVTASPSTIVPLGTTILLKGLVEDFVGSPTFTFSVDSSSVTVTQSGNEATLTSASTSYLQTQVTVVGRDSNGEELTVEGPVIFAPTTGCTLTKVTEGDPEIGDIVEFEVTADNNDAIKVTDVETGSGGELLSSNDSLVRIRYGTHGIRTVKVTAETTGTKAICNSGAQLEASVTVLPQLGCNISTGPNPSRTTSRVAVRIRPKGTNSQSQIEVIDFGSDEHAGLILTHDNGLDKTVEFFYGGIWPVRAKIRDKSNGRIATCQTQHKADLVVAACRARFIQDGKKITTARIEDETQLFVESNLGYGGISINPGAAVLRSPAPGHVRFPVIANRIVYNQQGSHTAFINVKNFGNGIISTCSTDIDITPEASCTVSGPSIVEITRMFRRGYTTSDQGPDPIPYKVEFSNVKPPITVDADDGCGNKTQDTNVQTLKYDALVPFQFSGVTTPVITHTDKFDPYPDTCSPGPVKVNKVTKTFVTGPYNPTVKVEVCNSTPSYQTIWIFTNGHPSTFDFHNIPPGTAHQPTCRHKIFYVHGGDNGQNEFFTKFKTLHNYNPHKRGLLGRVCHGPNHASCYDFPDL